MTAVEFIRMELRRTHKLLDAELEGLSEAQLYTVPGGHASVNTIAWGVFHVVRTEDNIVRFVLQNRRPPVWTEGGYAEKLGLPPVAQGTGMSAVEAQALRIRDLGIWREYQGKVWASTEEVFESSGADFWERAVTIKPIGEMPAWRAVAQIVLGHGLMHLGQLEMARTLVGATPVLNV